MTLLKRVSGLFDENHKVGNLNGFQYNYTSPSLKNYPHQWLWDSCFHTVVLTHFDMSRAKKEIITLLNNQHKNGFIPCVSIWNKRYPFEELFYLNTITQPPVIPISVELIYKRSKDMDFVNTIYPQLNKFMLWFYKNRDANKNSLIEVVHPWETGIDSTPTFDNQLGITELSPSFLKVMFKFLTLNKSEFKNENVLMNSIYAKSLKSMSKLAKVLGKKDDAAKYELIYQKVLASIIEHCWSENANIFFDLDDNGNQVEIKTISSLMPLIIDDLPEKYTRALIGHLTNKQEFWSRYPIPSVSMDESTFNPSKSIVLWRGPTWVNTNWFISKTLIDRGFKKEAKVIIKKTLDMVDKNGFWEFYNPLTGEGYGQPNFGWSTLVLDMV